MKFTAPDRRRAAAHEKLKDENGGAEGEHHRQMIARQRPEAGELKTKIPSSISKDRSKKNERNCHEDNQFPSEHDEELPRSEASQLAGTSASDNAVPQTIKRDADQAGEEQPHFGGTSLDRQREGMRAERRDPGEQRKGESENDQQTERVLGREALVTPEDREAHAVSREAQQDPDVPKNIAQRLQSRPRLCRKSPDNGSSVLLK